MHLPSLEMLKGLGRVYCPPRALPGVWQKGRAVIPGPSTHEVGIGARPIGHLASRREYPIHGRHCARYPDERPGPD